MLDPFGGSGTTLIAAHKTGRLARLAECDPVYCDAIIERFGKLTGKTVRHAETGQSFEALAEERQGEIVQKDSGDE